jgi:hypothetical protein
MIETKLFELRDAATFIPVVAMRMDPAGKPEPERYLLRRAGYGYGTDIVLFTRVEGGDKAEHDCYSWAGRRTFAVAHQYIQLHWGELESGAVVDVEFLLGLRATPKLSEREEGWPG